MVSSVQNSQWQWGQVTELQLPGTPHPWGYCRIPGDEPGCRAGCPLRSAQGGWGSASAGRSDKPLGEGPQVSAGE